MILGSSAKLQLALEGSSNKPLVESHLDDPNYFEGDLDIPQAIIDAYYEQQSEKDVSILQCYFILLNQVINFASNVHYFITINNIQAAHT